ncbi:MAG: MoaD/ThiS family protein [Gammaproteobacteria bacterium]|nr:MoaD/ThiS family protein [Gammaproteobacteria bacterium]MCP4091674.1 MoaD/ThiS family protein [Gammaproteobacteria bacterium]MCP4276170.1 MoaD/ThiS family protein [Gammaproteobacteria bacterium]MCP4831804.1 MoaD/ThiS family protein [Gammaproteobacteria bacterium]MCP4929740.1 MoaD/ThiS family protein [Gammaproteobacteria bacterium]
MKTVTIEYFAVLRECAGQHQECLSTSALTAGELFKELEKRYGFPELNSIKVAINDEFSTLNTPLTEGDIIVFIPPVAGG